VRGGGTPIAAAVIGGLGAWLLMSGIRRGEMRFVFAPARAFSRRDKPLFYWAGLVLNLLITALCGFFVALFVDTLRHMPA